MKPTYIVIGIAIVVAAAGAIALSSGPSEPGSDPELVQENTKPEEIELEGASTPDNPIKLPYKLDPKYMTTSHGPGTCDMTINGLKRESLGSTYEITLDITIKTTEVKESCVVRSYEEPHGNVYVTSFKEVMKNGPDEVLMEISLWFSDGSSESIHNIFDHMNYEVWRFHKAGEVKQYDPYKSFRKANDVEPVGIILTFLDVEDRRNDDQKLPLSNYVRAEYLEAKFIN